MKILDQLPHDTRRYIFSKINKKRFQRMQSKRLKPDDKGYSFAPFDKSRCIFVHVPKAAGVSLTNAFFGSLAGGHLTLSDYQLVFSKRDFDSYFKFSFVRNPWGRVFSAYSFLKKGGMSTADQDWSSKHLTKYKDFNDFIKNGLTDPQLRRWIHFIPQSDFLYLASGKTLGVDFVGRFENIQEDFSYIAAKLGLANSALEHRNATGTSIATYKAEYDEESIRIVKEIYYEDVRNFGYTFD